jgi:hypothetical protein
MALPSFHGLQLGFVITQLLAPAINNVPDIQDRGGSYGNCQCQEIRVETSGGFPRWWLILSKVELDLVETTKYRRYE